jgi:hypothetical protein
LLCCATQISPCSRRSGRFSILYFATFIARPCLCFAVDTFFHHHFLHLADHVCIRCCWQHAHYAHACRCMEDYQAGPLPFTTALQQHLEMQLMPSHRAMLISQFIRMRLRSRVRLTIRPQVHGADGLKVLASKASSISRRGAPPFSNLLVCGT